MLLGPMSHPARIALAVLPVLLVAAAPVSPPGRAATAAYLDEEPCAVRILLLGDSNIYGSLGRALQTRLEAAGYRVFRFGKPTSGLARPDFFDWLVEAPPRLALYRPDIVLFMAGGNDGQVLQPRPPMSKIIQFHSEQAWREEYGRRVLMLAELLALDGRMAFFLSPTNRRSLVARRKMQRVRAVQATALAGVPRVAWIDMGPPSSDEGGNYLARGPSPGGRRVALRHGDGIHLTDEGGRVVAERLLPILDARGLPGARSVCRVQAAGRRD